MNKKKMVIVSTVVCLMLCIAIIAVLSKIESDSIKQLYAEISNLRGGDLDNDIEYATKELQTMTDNEYETATMGRENIKGDYSKYVFVGDSRYRGMMFLAEEEDVFICENGRGYDFLLEQMSNIKQECDEDTALIIGLGVNDSHYNVDKYLDTLSEMADTMDCQIYYMLVNPVEEEKEEYNGYNVLNENIDIFNERMKDELDERIGIIDTNSYLWDYGFDTMDGLHYTNDTYEAIYYFIKSEITE